MRYPGGLYHPRAFQVDWPCTQMVEQPDTVPEQDGYQVDVYLVKKPRFDALLRDARGAYSDVHVARYCSCLLDGAFDAIRNESERRSFVDPFLRDRMGDNEGRYA